MFGKSPFLLAALTVGACMYSANSAATIVLFKTNMGDFEVNLYDQTTPQTVQNFLSYVKAGSYNNTVMHRSIPGFIIQGGGFTFNSSNSAPWSAITSQSPVKNEAKWSNVRGTIAMAKPQDLPDGATSQWFINIADNSAGSAQLDIQNKGFTVFGQVTGTGMTIADNVNKLTSRTVAGLSDVPLRNYTAADVTQNTPVTNNNVVIIESITVINNDPNSAASLNPVPNTAITKPTVPPTESSSSGGSFGAFALLTLGWLGWRRRQQA